MTRVFVLFVVFFCFHSLGEVLLRSRTVKTDLHSHVHRKDLSFLGGEGLMILQLQPALSVEEMEEVSTFLKLELPAFLHVLNNDAYIVRGKLSFVSQKVEEIPNLVRYVGRYQPSDKTLMDFKNVRRRSVKSNDEDSSPIRLLVSLYSNIHSDMTDFPSNANYELIDDNTLSIEIHDLNSAHSILSYLKSHEGVLWIEIDRKMSFHNYASKLLLESGTDASSTPIHSKGYTGSGVMVGVMDTGIDVRNCYFNDPSHTVTSGGPQSHRKIKYYISTTGSDLRDGPSGHGTHVAGTICGSTTSSDEFLKKYNGVAPGASLYFVDIENSNEPGTVKLPSNISALLEGMSGAGVQISSNSWGCGLSTYVRCSYPCTKCTWQISEFEGQSKGAEATDDDCKTLYGANSCCEICNEYSARERALDRYVREVDDGMLLLFAGGNDGSVAVDRTVTAPGTAKNVLSVGSGMSTLEGLVESTKFFDVSTQIEAACASYLGITDKDACHTALPSISSCCSHSNDGVKFACCDSYQKQWMEDNKGAYSQHNLASFSSKGPTYDGRTKPDVVAPGYRVISAHSRGKTQAAGAEFCGAKKSRPDKSDEDNDAALLSLKGTSMSCPVMAGGLALALEYLRAKRDVLGLGPTERVSGALLKAMGMHGGESLTGWKTEGNKLKRFEETGFPTNEQGYGLPVLGNVLDLGLNADFRLEVHNRKTILERERHVYCFKQTKASVKEMRVTVAWYDYAGTPASKTLLVNRLDLYLCLGYERASGACWAGNGVKEGDRVNTAEQVRVPAGSVGVGNKFAFVVVARKLQSADKKQTYSVVHTGYGFERYKGSDCNVTDTPIFPEAVEGGGDDSNDGLSTGMVVLIILLVVFSVAAVVLCVICMVVFLGVAVSLYFLIQARKGR